VVRHDRSVLSQRLAGCTGRPQQRAGGEAPTYADAVGEQRGAPGVVGQHGREREAERLRDLAR
jgi:hypothetical protein